MAVTGASHCQLEWSGSQMMTVYYIQSSTQDFNQVLCGSTVNLLARRYKAANPPDSQSTPGSRRSPLALPHPRRRADRPRVPRCRLPGATERGSAFGPTRRCNRSCPVGPVTARRTAIHLPGCSWNSDRNGGRGSALFVADPRAARVSMCGAEVSETPAAVQQKRSPTPR